MPGAVVAGGTALVSGVSIFVNSYGVHSIRDPAVYTTAKNAVAAVFLIAAAGVFRALRSARRDDRARRPGSGGAPALHGLSAGSYARWFSWAYVGVVGGGIAFVLFFEGLARMSAEPAAFLHDTMLVWVAILALPFLGERLSLWNLGAIVLLVGGQVAISGGIGRLVLGEGPLLVLGATVLWAVETVVAKRLLESTTPVRLSVLRMGIGVVVLVAFVAATGHFGALAGLDAAQLGWALLTGGLLAGYVGTWMVALSRARALDVTSVLVASVVVTSLLQLAAGHAISLSETVGLVLVALGSATVVRVWPRLATAR
ncbi:MAG TPA: DMT family transporter [Acidimicrobiales bacterium]|nr:DMT family transporter [Acidimicrobiales bacterium]